MDQAVRALFRSGPVGTGAFLLGPHGSGSGPRDVEVWLCLLFFPLVPLSRWRISSAEGDAETLELTVHSRVRPGAGAALGRLGRAVAGTALMLAPLAFGVWKAGAPWATSLLTAALGSLVGSGVLGKLGMAVEMGVVLGGAMIPVLVLLHLDERTPRVPLRSALGLRLRRGATVAGTKPHPPVSK